MAQVWRDKKYSILAERLVEKGTGYCGQKIFLTFRDLMVFAAMVGFHHSKKNLVLVNDRAFEIPQRVFEYTEADAYVYLCALQDQKSGEIFREKNENLKKEKLYKRFFLKKNVLFFNKNFLFWLFNDEIRK